MLNPRIVRQTWNIGNEQRDPRIEQIPGLRVTYMLTILSCKHFEHDCFELDTKLAKAMGLWEIQAQ